MNKYMNKFYDKYALLVIMIIIIITGLVILYMKYISDKIDLLIIDNIQGSGLQEKL